MVDPEEEEFVLAECVESAEGRPEEELVHCQRESSTEQVAGTLLEWNTQKSLCWRSVVSSQLQRPSLVSIVVTTSVFKWNNQRRGWQEGHN